MDTIGILFIKVYFLKYAVLIIATVRKRQNDGTYKSPMEVWTGRELPDICHRIKVWGCSAWVQKYTTCHSMCPRCLFIWFCSIVSPPPVRNSIRKMAATNARRKISITFLLHRFKHVSNSPNLNFHMKMMIYFMSWIKDM